MDRSEVSSLATSPPNSLPPFYYAGTEHQVLTHFLSSNSGAWLVFPTYMGYVFAKDILRGLAIASGDVSSRPARLAIEGKDD